jgi:hypothetical protein
MHRIASLDLVDVQDFTVAELGEMDGVPANLLQTAQVRSGNVAQIKGAQRALSDTDQAVANSPATFFVPVGEPSFVEGLKQAKYGGLVDFKSLGKFGDGLWPGRNILDDLNRASDSLGQFTSPPFV